MDIKGIGEATAIALGSGAVTAFGGWLKMRDTVNASKGEIAAMAEKHKDCCERLDDFQAHIIDRNVHIDRDMWREVNDRLKRIEEYILNHK